MTDPRNESPTGDILLAEDSATQAALLEDLLLRHGFTVRLATDGLGALLALRQRPADIVLSDIVMPGMDGFELCRQIHADAALAGIPVVLLTEFQAPADLVRALSSGASGFLPKPCDEEALLERLRHLLANRTYHQQAAPALHLDFRLGGQDVQLDTGQTHLLDLLVSTFEGALRQGRHLDESHCQLREALGAVEAMSRLLQGERPLDEELVRQLHGTRVLVVEDSEVQAERLRSALEEHGLEVTVAHDGQAGLAMARERLPEVILSDVVMPVMDGYEMCRYIKQDDALARVPVVLLTTLSNPEDIVHGMNAGADFYLTKPCESDYLLYRLAAILNSARQPRTEEARERTDVRLGGKTYEVRASRRQLLDLMISTYENAVQQNRELQRLKAELQTVNAQLEDLVAVRTSDLLIANRRLEQAMSDLKAQQQQVVQQERLRALGEMSSGIAHDFNNCLSIIMGFAELLRSSACTGHQSAKCRRSLDLIYTAAKDGADVVSRLREFYRSRDKDEAFGRVDLVGLIRQSVALTTPKWRAQAQARGIGIQIVERLDPVPAILGHSPELREVLTNLIMNAADAMAADGAITVSLGQRDNRVEVAIADTGQGMDEATRQRCLEPFFTTKGSQGTGLGLSVAYGIIRRHGGTMEIASAPGAGTTITLTFEPADDHHGGAGHEPAAHPVGPPRCVLVVDDSASIREVVRELLLSDGHQVLDYASGSDALREFRHGCFDLAIIDRAMPGMGGDQLAAELKQRSPLLPIVMLTGFGSMMNAAGERPAAVDLVIAKPIDFLELRRAIAKVTHDLPG